MRAINARYSFKLREVGILIVTKEWAPTCIYLGLIALPLSHSSALQFRFPPLAIVFWKSTELGFTCVCRCHHTNFSVSSSLHYERHVGGVVSDETGDCVL